jgi:hypothetical protein
MRIWQPWETAWPAGAALLLCLVAVAAGGWRWVRVDRRDRLLAAALLGLAIVVRLLAVPAWVQHTYDGHEAEYFDLFRGVREPNRGGTVLYPAMQWLWWGLGRVLPAWPRLPMALSALVGAAGAVVTAATVRRLATPAAGLAAGVLVALHPVHAAWSSSAYNVVLPWTLGAGVLWCGAVLAGSRRAPRSIAWLGAGLFALTVATRMDAALVGLPAALLVLTGRPGGMAWGAWLRDRAALLPALFAGLALCGAAVYPLVFPGEVPGAGERALSFAVNLPLIDLYLPRWAGLGLALAGVGGLFALRRWPAATLALVVGVVANHLVLASFDDLGDRHLLTGLVGLVFAVGAGAAAAPGGWRVGGPLLGAWVLVCGLGLADLRPRFYGSEEAHTATLSAEPWSALPRWTEAEARTRGGAACGWVAEDPRVSSPPVASHFNLLDPEEAAALRGPDGCLRWCADVQDWRWSSRGVRDRAVRLAHLYALEPVAVVEEPRSGYACLVLEVGARTCCGAAADPGDPGGTPAAPDGVAPPENDVRSAFPHPPLP